ncbi:isotrichodermin C-15 hydroxylase [Xylariales sp. PMI_506]|nr:isotrichodermin C-15 hydroxylase [Xylariales sp. PMI_506]
MVQYSSASTGTSHVLFYFYAISGITVSYLVLSVIYNLFFHPLRRIPGPLLQRASPLPYSRYIFGGRAPFHVHELHEKYGPVVRLSPNHLSFIDVRAWKDIYDRRPPPSDDPRDSLLDENPKSKYHYGFFPGIPTTIISATRSEHALLRDALIPGFSDKALRTQEPRIRRYVNLLVNRLRQHAETAPGKSATVDLNKWYSWASFDIIGDLIFAESFRCLEQEDWHPFMRGLVGSRGMVLVVLNYTGFLWLTQLLCVVLLRRLIFNVQGFLVAMVERRLSAKVEIEDLFEGLMRHRKDGLLDDRQLRANARFLLMAGFETTATSMNGVTYLLLTHPEAMEKLKQEVRSTFNSSEEITITSVSRLPYMLGCINESLRLYPSVPGSMVRVMAKGGGHIAGHWVPEGTMIECQQWAMNHSSNHWTDPWEFRPERYLESEKSRDNREALQPFNVGPRDCAGRGLAHAEMRLVLANIVYNFDWKLADDSKNWMEGQRAYPFWRSGPLNVVLTPASSSI